MIVPLTRTSPGLPPVGQRARGQPLDHDLERVRRDSSAPAPPAGRSGSPTGSGRGRSGVGCRGGRTSRPAAAATAGAGRRDGHGRRRLRPTRAARVGAGVGHAAQAIGAARGGGSRRSARHQSLAWCPVPEPTPAAAPSPAAAAVDGGGAGAGRAGAGPGRPRSLGPLGERFAAAGEQLALVGGPVRDAMLGRLQNDIDLTTSARPETTEALLAGWADAVWDMGRDFGTIGCRKGDWTIEITTYRSEQLRPGVAQARRSPTATRSRATSAAATSPSTRWRSRCPERRRSSTPSAGSSTWRTARCAPPAGRRTRSPTTRCG